MHYFLAEVEQCSHAFIKNIYFKQVMGFRIACLDISLDRNVL